MRSLVFILIGLLLFEQIAAKGDSKAETEDRKKEDETDHEHRQVTRRTLEVKVKDDEVEVEGKVKEGKVKDSVKFVMRTNGDDGFRIRFEHKAKQEDQSASNLKFLVHLQELIEYLPATAGAEFQPDATGNSSTSQVLRRWKLRRSDWGKFTQTKTAAGVYEITCASAGGVVIVRGSVAEADSTTAAAGTAVALDANSLKVDVEVHNWQWASGVKDSRLALRVAVKSVHTEGHDKDAKDRDAAAASGQVKFAETEGGQPGGRFRWADTVTADGNTASVKSFIVARTDGSEDGEGYRSWNDVYFSFLTATQAKDIVWDPQVGLDYSTLATGPSTGLIVGLVVGGIALLALVALVAVVVVRRRAANGGAEELSYRSA